tara:strand:+ start:265 stop:1752 length:1488 start_codon:yes stop_codon:yes gene_type:complete
MSKIKEIFEKFNIPLCGEPYERKERSTAHGREYVRGNVTMTWGSLSEAFHNEDIEIWDRQRPDIGAGDLKKTSSPLSTLFFGEQPNDVLLCLLNKGNGWKTYVLNGHQRLSGLHKFIQKNVKLPNDKFFNSKFDIEGYLTSIGGYSLDELEQTYPGWFFNNVLSRHVDVKYIILGDDWDEDDKISTMVHYFVYSNEAISYNHRLPALNIEFTNQLFNRDKLIYPKHDYHEIFKITKKLDGYTKFQTSIGNGIKGVINDDITSMAERKNLDLILFRYGLSHICEDIRNKKKSLSSLIKFLKSFKVEKVYQSLEREKDNSEYYKFLNDVDMVDKFFEHDYEGQNEIFGKVKKEFKNKGVKSDAKSYMSHMCTKGNINYHVAMVCILFALSGEELDEIIKRYVELFECAHLSFTSKTFSKWHVSQQNIFKAKVRKYNELTNKNIVVEEHDNFESDLVRNMRTVNIIDMLLELVGYGMFNSEEINERVLSLLKEKHKVY